MTSSSPPPAQECATAHQVFSLLLGAQGYQARPQQTKLLDLLSHGRTTGLPVFAQAGTGTGKSFVLLSAAVAGRRASGKPSVIVCPTNALVDQYVHKDAPQVAAATGATFMHLKGRSRYLCASSLELGALGQGAEAAYLKLIELHGGPSGSADLDRFPDGFTPDTHGCPGSKRCAGGGCGALEARAAAARFDVVITNAHVMVWDRRVRDLTYGKAALLPDYGTLLVDEAHELDGAGRSCLDDQITLRSKVHGLVPELRGWLAPRTAAMRKERLTETAFEPDAPMLRWRDQVDQAARLLRDQIDQETSAESADYQQVQHWRDELAVHDRFLDLFRQQDKDGTRFITTIDEQGSLLRICVDASPLLGRILRAQPSVLVSGTVPQSLPARLGVGGGSAATVHNVGHPFDYSRCQLVISQHSAKSRDRKAFVERVAGVAHAIAQARGGTLVLFTSWADLESVMPQVGQQLEREGFVGEWEIPIFLQDRQNPASLKDDIAEFTSHGNAVLAGVRSLFTGIDVPGRALRQVVMWKLPYPVPTLERQAVQAIHGRQVYFDEMLTLLAQGIGRLVRTPDDKGRALIMDSRAKSQRWHSSPLTAHLSEFGTRP